MGRGTLGVFCLVWRAADFKNETRPNVASKAEKRAILIPPRHACILSYHHRVAMYLVFFKTFVIRPTGPKGLRAAGSRLGGFRVLGLSSGGVSPNEGPSFLGGPFSTGADEDFTVCVVSELRSVVSQLYTCSLGWQTLAVCTSPDAKRPEPPKTRATPRNMDVGAQGAVRRAAGDELEVGMP